MNYIVNDYEIQNALEIKKLITMTEQHFSGGYLFKGESHNFYEAVCVLDGAVDVTAGKNIFTLSAGNMILHKPLVFHAIKEHENSGAKCIFFSFTASHLPRLRPEIYSLSEPLQKSISNICKTVSDSFIISTISAVPLSDDTSSSTIIHGGIIEGVQAGMESKASRLIKQLEIFLLEAFETPKIPDHGESDPSKENYRKILSVMENEIENAVSVADIAKQCKLSVPTVEKVIHKYMGCGAMAYYNTLRMNRAYKLLKQGDSVKSVALSLGFSTQHYFSLSFKKHFGYPPSALSVNKKG